WKGWFFRGQWISIGGVNRGTAPLDSHQVRQRQRPNTTRALLKETAPGLNVLKLLKCHQSLPGYKFVEVQQDAAEANPGGRLSPVDAFKCSRKKCLAQFGVATDHLL